MGAGCALHDPLTGSFDGRFASRVVQIAMLSDSLGNQVRSALESAIAANPKHLGSIRFARGNHGASSAMRPLNLATIPRAPRGVRSLLGSIDWSSAGGGTSGGHGKRSSTAHHAPPGTGSTLGSTKPVRIVLASSGMWYNLRPFCNGTGAGSLFGLSPNATCGHKVLGHTIRPEDVPLNHSEPLGANPVQFWRAFHRHFGVPPWGWYAWARRLQGTATIREYEADVRSFLEAATKWAASASAHLVWMETTPQHFANTPGGAGGCSAIPATPMDPHLPWPPELDALCNASASTPSPTTDCRGDWRNHIARRLLRERGIPVVPLAAALSSRSDLHTGGAGDCTHWCEGTEASVFLSSAVLNVLAELLRSSDA